MKQSTALELDFWVFDSNGDGVTGIADGSFTKRIKKTGGAWAALTITISEGENGWYSMTLSSSHTDTLGVLSVSLSAAGIKRVNLQFRVHARVPDDHAFPTVSGRSIDVTTTGEVGLDLDNTAGALGTAQFDSAFFTAALFAADAITAAKVAADVGTEIAGAVWNEDATGHQTQGSFGQVIGDSVADSDSIWSLVNTNLDATVSSRLASASISLSGGAVTVGTNNDKTGYRLSATGVDDVWDEPLALHTTADTAGLVLNMLTQDTVTLSTDVALGSIFGQLLDNGTAWTFDRTTDSLEAVRDRGDAAWTTSTLDAAGVRTAVGLASANLDTQLAAIAADNPNAPTRGVQLSNLPFMMVDATDLNTPETGVSITATISKDGAAFGACTNSPSEISGGWYKITLTATEMTADMIALKFTGTGCAQRNIAFRTQPT